MIFHFFDTASSDSEENQATPLLSVLHGAQEFQSFYDFLIKTVPAMEQKTQ